MTMSLDGFVADQEGNVGKLYPDFAELQGSDAMRASIEETGAVLMGRRTFAMGDPDSYVGEYEFQVPIFVLSSAAHPADAGRAPHVHLRRRRCRGSGRPSEGGRRG